MQIGTALPQLELTNWIILINDTTNQSVMLEIDFFA